MLRNEASRGTLHPIIQTEILRRRAQNDTRIVSSRSTSLWVNQNDEYV